MITTCYAYKVKFSVNSLNSIFIDYVSDLCVIHILLVK